MKMKMLVGRMQLVVVNGKTIETNKTIVIAKQKYDQT